MPGRDCVSQARKFACAAIPAVAIAGVLYDQLFIATSYNSIAGSLGVSSEQCAVLLSIYFVFVGSLMMMWGRFAQVVGAPRLLVGGVVGLAVGEAFSFVPGGLPVLMIARMITATAAAAIIPCCFTIVSETFETAKGRNAAFAGLAAMTGLGGVLGSLSGALFGSSPAWRVAWALPAIVLAIAILLLQRFLPEIPAGLSWVEFDAVSCGLVSVGLLAFTTVLAEGGQIGWIKAASSISIGPVHMASGLPVVPVLVATFVVAFSLLGFRQQRRAHKGETILLGRGLLRIHRFRNGVAILALFSLTSSGIIGALPLFQAYAFGTTALRIGLHAVMVSVGITVGGFSVAPLARRLSHRMIISCAIILQVASVVSMAALPLNRAPSNTYLISFLIFGLSVGLGLGSLNNVMLADVHDGDLLSASSFSQTAANLASGLAVTTATFVYVSTGDAMNRLDRSGLSESQRSALDQVTHLRQPTVDGLGSTTQAKVTLSGVLHDSNLQSLQHQITNVVLKQFTLLIVLSIGLSCISLVLAWRMGRQPAPAGD